MLYFCILGIINAGRTVAISNVRIESKCLPKCVQITKLQYFRFVIVCFLLNFQEIWEAKINNLHKPEAVKICIYLVQLLHTKLFRIELQNNSINSV